MDKDKEWGPDFDLETMDKEVEFNNSISSDQFVILIIHTWKTLLKEEELTPELAVRRVIEDNDNYIYNNKTNRFIAFKVTLFLYRTHVMYHHLVNDNPTINWLTNNIKRLSSQEKDNVVVVKDKSTRTIVIKLKEKEVIIKPEELA
ncbi:hypothetical protein OMP38_03240 [Cohnella ginsengisoli]|uniref:Uncharacterized protein n=1 Tax=Cohnella ginsengisoli TaxID=425004 RepID=A0A9X4QKS6_9BACL|nr:hypothetical protein [Cohnella ginsengisoli]MDG0789978.1 hypothetical protein [Cohnella ginsengisoli]